MAEPDYIQLAMQTVKTMQGELEAMATSLLTHAPAQTFPGAIPDSLSKVRLVLVDMAAALVTHPAAPRTVVA